LSFSRIFNTTLTFHHHVNRKLHVAEKPMSNIMPKYNYHIYSSMNLSIFFLKNTRVWKPGVKNAGFGQHVSALSLSLHPLPSLLSCIHTRIMSRVVVLLVFNRGDDGDETDEKTKLFDGSCGLGDKMGALGTGTDTMSQKAGDSSFCTLAAGRGVSRSSPLQGRVGVRV